MRTIYAGEMEFSALSELMRETDEDLELLGCLGQRFIGAGMGPRRIRIRGVPGNALGAYLNGAELEVFGNAQDAVGDTMNAGRIVIHGNIGDTAGYAMRGGRIFVRGDAGYRTGIHMKEYREHRPAIVIGGRAGSFLGEYQAGGVIAVLGLGIGRAPIVGGFPCTGMHGGRLILRSDCRDVVLPKQVTARAAGPEDLREIGDLIGEYADALGLDAGSIMDAEFTVVTPDSMNPYHQLYVTN